MDDILTPRLVLRLMSERFLRATQGREVEAAESAIGLRLPKEWFDSPDMVERELRLRDEEMIERELRLRVEDPRYIPWSARAIGLSSSGAMVGHIRFHSPPDPEYLRPYVGDGVELGYTIFAPHRRLGFASEAIHGLIRWAATDRGVERFVVSISPSNTPSTELAAKLGFVKVCEWQDDVDGLEYVYELTGNRLNDLLTTI
jgi:RimJ/RimL family protein N-acetyltransferase